MTTIIHAALFTPTRRGWGLPVLFWGPPGCGKSDMLEEEARRWSMTLQVLSPGEQGDGAFGVTPVPIGSGEDTRITYPAPSWVDCFDDSDGRGVVFVDEITTAPPGLQPALLGLVHARRIGGATLPPGVRVIGACNPPEQAAGGWDRALPVANRFGHLDWSMPSSSDWGQWMMGNSAISAQAETRLSASAEEARVLAEWDMPFAKAKGTVVAFVTRRPAVLHRMPNPEDPNASRAWPSHRTWEMATRALTSASVHRLSPSERDTFVASFIGSDTMTEFAAFVAALDLPDPADVLDGKVSWRHDPRRLDRTFAVLTSCTSLVTSLKETDPSRLDRAERLWSILADVSDGAQDLVVPQVTPLSKARLTRSKVAITTLAKLKPVLDAAGLGV